MLFRRVERSLLGVDSRQPANAHEFQLNGPGAYGIPNLVLERIT